MKNPKIQFFKMIIAIVLMITTSIIIYNYESLQNKVAIITKDSNNEITHIKYSKGTEIIETRQSDGKEPKSNDLKLKNNGVLLTNKIDLNLRDESIPDNINEIDADVVDDNIIINFNKPNDNGTKYEYKIKNKNKERVVNYYAKSDIKGYSYVVDNNPNEKASFEINKMDESPIIEHNIDWNDDYYFHIRSIDNTGNCSENKTFKIELPSKGLNIEYIDINSGDKIENDEILNGIVKQDYDATNMIKEVDNYQLIDIEGELEGKLKKEKTYVVCKYAKDSQVQINYIDNNTGKKVSDSVYIDGYEGKNINIWPKRIEGFYENNKEMTYTMEEGSNTIDFYYYEIPKGTISIKYIDEESLENISEPLIIEDYVNTEYIAEKREINGYEIVQEPENTEGIISNEDKEIVFFYKKIEQKEEISINEDTNTNEGINTEERVVRYVDYDTKRVLMTEKIESNKVNKIKIKRIEGYRLMNKDEFDKEESLIDELINALDINQDFTQDKMKNENVIIPKKKESNKLSEYEIVMNCDDSDYIIYYKK